jgi:hypothetical protein
MEHPESTTEANSESAALARKHAISEATLRRMVSWLGVVGTMAFGAFFLAYLVFHAVNGAPASGWLLLLLEQHYPAVVGIPMSAVGAFCVVTLFKIAHGPIEIEGFGLKFRGASAPIVFWVLCFAAFVWSLYLLWPHTKA